MDPEHGDFRLQLGSPAEGYGCFGFPGPHPAAVAAPIASLPASLPRRTSMDVGGPITTDTVWAADTVRVHTPVTVADGATLTVAAGSYVEFQGFYELAVQGRLLAVGEPDRPVWFDRAEGIPDITASDTTASWRGIEFIHTPETNEPSLLRHCIVDHALGSWPDRPGGALTFVGFSRCRVENSQIRYSTADRGGAVHCSHHAAPELVGCLITGNDALEAGSALYCLEGYPRLIGCTITDNIDHNPEIFDRAAAVVSMLAKPTLTGCIVWDNPGNYYLDQLMIHTKPHYVTWCDVEFGHEGMGNLALDPLFVGSGDHPFSLLDLSPCRDAGPPDVSQLGLPAVDLAGEARVSGGRVDMGCYEVVDPTSGMVPPGGHLAAALLAPVYPNPFNPQTTVAFTLPTEDAVRLEIVDVAGRLVRTLVTGERYAAGRHEVRWTGRDDMGRAVASGVYLARLRTAGRVEQRSLVLVR